MPPALVTHEWNSDLSPAQEHVSFPQTIDALFQFSRSGSELRNILHDNLTRVMRQTGRDLV
jgi:hypothetical protein